jgi:nitrate reductase alpha subunit
MAKGKGGKSKDFISQGKHSNVSKSTLRLMRAAKTSADKMIDKQKAWLKGQNPWITIENPNKEQTNRRHIRIRMNDLMGGSAKDREKRMFITK